MNIIMCCVFNCNIKKKRRKRTQKNSAFYSTIVNNAGPPYTAGQAESSTNLWSRRERTGHVLFLSAGVESHVSPDTCAVSSHVCIKGHVS